MKIFRLLSGVGLLCLISLCVSAADKPSNYTGTPFHDSVYSGGPQVIPGRVKCAFYDLGGEGVAYHDSDAKNNGSGGLNPADGTYLNEFRKGEGVDTSYTKFRDQPGKIDNNPFNLVPPEPNQLYVGWTEPGEWFNMTVLVKKAGTYAIDLMYTSNHGGNLSLDLNGKKLTGPISIVSTYNAADPVAWRQWHHWNKISNIATFSLPQGKHVLTLHVLDSGMNLDYLEFKLLKAK